MMMAAATQMTKEQTKDKLVEVLQSSGLCYDDQIRAISMARVAIQPRQADWRIDAKPILKHKDRVKLKEQK